MGKKIETVFQKKNYWMAVAAAVTAAAAAAVCVFGAGFGNRVQDGKKADIQNVREILIEDSNETNREGFAEDGKADWEMAVETDSAGKEESLTALQESSADSHLEQIKSQSAQEELQAIQEKSQSVQEELQIIQEKSQSIQEKLPAAQKESPVPSQKEGLQIPCDRQDYDTLLKIVQAEAGNCDSRGKILVANVIMNRVKSSEFPDGITEVVYEKSQFSPVSDGSIDRIQVTQETISCVNRALGGEDHSQGALYFMNRGASSSQHVRWFDEKLTFLFGHGGHEFFK